MGGRPVERSERHNNGALVPTTHTVETKTVQSVAVVCPLRFHPVSSVCSIPTHLWPGISENRITKSKQNPTPFITFSSLEVRLIRANGCIFFIQTLRGLWGLALQWPWNRKKRKAHSFREQNQPTNILIWFTWHLAALKAPQRTAGTRQAKPFFNLRLFQPVLKHCHVLEHFQCYLYAKRNCCVHLPTHTVKCVKCVCVFFSRIKQYLPIVVLFSVPLRSMDGIVSHPNASGGRQPRSDSSVECFTSLLLFLYLYLLPVSIGR